MSAKKHCCYKCEKRSVYKVGDKTITCHSTCEDFRDEQAQNEERNKIIREQKNKEGIYFGYAHDGKVKHAKKQEGKWQ